MKNRKKLISILAGIMAAVMLLSLILSLIPVARAASSSEIRNQINDLKGLQSEIQNQKSELESHYQKNEDEIINLVNNKNLIDQEIFLLYAEIGNINQQINSYALLIADKQDEIDAAQARFDAMSDEHRERIRAMEEEGTLSYWAVLFNASSFSDLLDRLNMIEEIAASDRRRLDALNKAANEVEQAKAALEVEKEDLEKTRRELDEAYAELEAKQTEAQEMIAKLLQKAEEIEGLFESYELEEQQLMSEIAAKEKEYNDAKYQEWLAHMATATTAPPPTTVPPTTAPPETAAPPAATEPDGTTEPSGSGETEPPATQPPVTEPPATEVPPATEPPATEPPATQPPATESWIRPCSYVKLTSPFGYRDAPTEGASTYHQGVDLAGPEGTPIYASRSGTVTTARYSNSAGYYVSINHGDGYSSIYMHMTTYTVSAGQNVSQGQLIGYMGNTGISTGSHLHFGISYNGTYVNPALYVPL